jgi:NAD(P)-dependent dehydrogenase (short-subunit alcohol dehydrogenase family)
MSQVAVITGAASGIGAGLARQAAALGMQVVLADRDAAQLTEVARSIGDAALAVTIDVTDPAQLEHLAEQAWAAHGKVDLRFNNAGVLSTGFSWEIPGATWQASLDVNIGGIVNALRAFVPRLIAADRPARIVNTASVGGFLPSPMMAPYSATKAAVVALTESLAGELAALGSKVSVSLLAPGPVKSEIFREPPPGPAQHFHAAMTAMLDEHGLTADEFAPLVFDAVARGDYWIIPQPAALDHGFAARNAIIAERRQPQFYSVDDKA